MSLRTCAAFVRSFAPITTLAFAASVAELACGQAGHSSASASGSTQSGTGVSTSSHGGSATGTATSRSGSSTGVNTTGTGTETGTTSSGDGGQSSQACGGSSSGSSGSYVWNNVAFGGGGFVSGIVFSPVQSGLAYARTDVGGFYRWNDATTSWVPLVDWLSAAQGNYFGGESIAPDPVDASVVYAAAGEYLSGGNGAILRSADQGATWTINPIPVAMGGNATGRGMGERLAVDPNNNTILLFGTRNNGLYKSANSGSTWAPVTSFTVMGDADYGLPVVVFDKTGGSAAGSNTIYVAAAALKGTGSNLYVTKNGGTSWTEVAGGPTGLIVHHAALGSDDTLWLAYSNDYGPYNASGVNTLSGQIWKYAAGTWTNVTPTTWGGMAGGISVDAQNPLHVVVATLDWYAPDKLLATTDGGTSWTVIAQPPVSYETTGSTYDANGALFWNAYGPQIGTGATNWVEAVALDPFNSNRVMYGTGAGIWVSTNIGSAASTEGQGVTWTFLDKGLEETVPQYLVPSVHGAFLGAIGDLGGARNTCLDSYSTTGEYVNPIMTTTSWIDFAEANPNFVVRVGDSGTDTTDVAYSMDNGQTWTPCATAPAGYAAAYNTNNNLMQSVAVAADGSRFLVAPTATTKVVPSVTSDNGMTWTASTGLPAGAFVASDRVNAMTFYATSGGTLYVSTDGGKTFKTAGTFSGSGAPRPVFGIAGEVWVSSSNNALYRFTGVGTAATATMTQVSTASSVTGVGFGMAATGQTHPAMYIIGTVGGQYGFFRSDDGLGASWVRVNDDQHQYGPLQGNYVAGDETVYGRIYLTTSGRGYVYGDIVQ